MSTKISKAFLLIFASVALMMSAVRAEYYCGRANACYMVPPGCTYGDCDFEVVWSRQENTTKYDFKIAARATGWVAVGFSSDKSMASFLPITHCIASSR